MRTVFFGPFLGEFGWELSFWHGWVRKACREAFQQDRKIACSYPGRQPFYPEVDEFWPLPEEFVRKVKSPHAYYADGWRRGYPGIREQVLTFRSVAVDLLHLRRPRKRVVERPVNLPDLEPEAERLLEMFRRKLPEDTLFFTPWKPNRFEPDGLEFGIRILEGKGKVPRFQIKPIDFKDQQFELLGPTPAGEKAFLDRIGERELIAVFPRHRNLRRPEKNWSKEKYQELIQLLQRQYPDLAVAVLGEPGGAYFADGVPEGCLDLIHVPASLRMDVQIAALKRARMALGGISGALLVALAAGCPTLIWGYAAEQARYHGENVLGTPLIYHADADASVKTVLELSSCLRRMALGSSSVLEKAASR